MREVADDLGNTPTVARSSYVDPRVVEAFLRGEAIDTVSPRSAEQAVLQLLDE